MGMTSKRAMHARIVYEGFRPIITDTRDHVNAPTTPEVVAMTLMSASAAGSMRRDVLAKRIAVPDTVAMASEIMNHAPRKSRTSFRLRACMTVLPRLFQE